LYLLVIIYDFVCKATIVHPKNESKTLNLGISHAKSKFPGRSLPQGILRNTYLSRFFAFEPSYPYQVVAQSGLFCLGYPTEETEYDGTPHGLSSVIIQTGNFVSEINHTTTTTLHELTNGRPMYMKDTTFQCPKIHFVMSVIDKVDDSTKVIISYGVDDCLSRFVHVDKRSIQKMLFGGMEREII
jgi:hypothetical protein